MDSLPLLSVARTKDGVWTVNERSAERTAIAYFPKKWDAMKHAVKAAKARRQARVVVLEGDCVCLSRDYHGPDTETERVEVP